MKTANTAPQRAHARFVNWFRFRSRNGSRSSGCRSTGPARPASANPPYTRRTTRSSPTWQSRMRPRIRLPAPGPSPTVMIRSSAHSNAAFASPIRHGFTSREGTKVTPVSSRSSSSQGNDFAEASMGASRPTDTRFTTNSPGCLDIDKRILARAVWAINRRKRERGRVPGHPRKKAERRKVWLPVRPDGGYPGDRPRNDAACQQIMRLSWLQFPQINFHTLTPPIPFVSWYASYGRVSRL